MSMSSISSTSGNFSAQAPQRTPEAVEVQKSGRDNDRDSDDGGAGTVKSVPPPTVNMSGQKIGQIINVSA
jgi:hypothetical protein